MANKAIGFLLLTALWFGLTTGLENTTETYIAESATSEITELTVIAAAELRGDIQWHSDSNNGSVGVVIIKYAESASELDQIEVVIQESIDSLEVRATYNPSRPSPDNSVKNMVNFLVFTLLILLSGIMLFQGKTLTLLTAVLAILLSFHMYSAQAQLDLNLSIEIDIHVPRDFLFKKVSLLTIRGSIQVDQELIDLQTPLECSGGTMNETCPACCNGNGKCTNGKCECDLGFRNGTMDCDERTETTLNLFVNPLDPVIVGAKTPDGDNIYMIGEKDSNGNPTKVERFQVIDSDGNSTFTQLDDNGTITSAVHSSGMSMKFAWDENFTSVNLTLVLPDSSQQFFIKVDLTDNSTNITFIVDGQEIDKRSIDDDEILFEEEKKRIKRPQTQHGQNYVNLKTGVRSRRETTSSARVSINVSSCGEPEPDAIVQADVLHDDVSTTYTAVASTTTAGLYYVYIPTQPASMIGEAVGEVCNSIEMALDKACGWYDKAKKFIRYFTKHSLEKIVCFYLGKDIKLFIPQLRLIPVYKFCKTIFKGIDYYCDEINAPIIEGVEKKKSELVCDLITEYTDNVIDFFSGDTDIHFTPSALFPAGYTIKSPGRILSLAPGSSIVSTTFTINDMNTSLVVDSDNPHPGKGYTIYVQSECYSNLTYVYITILGTDNYYDETSCTGGPSPCILHVPGAAPDVHDTVTVKIFDYYGAITPTQILYAFVPFEKVLC